MTEHPVRSSQSAIAGHRPGPAEALDNDDERTPVTTSITDSITALPGEPEPPVQQHERATWVLSRHDGHWLIDAYHSSPKHAS